ncbi:MAG TPA: AMP-binding protein, partial [Dongiaceae bacterium]
MADIDEFLAARDFLMRHRDDYATAYESFRWPALTRFNWALDYFDRIEDGENRTALWIVDDSGAESRLSFADLSRRSNQVANHLRRLGVRRGERILLMLGNVVPLWETMLAAMKLGAVVIPSTTLLGPTDLADRITRGRVGTVIAPAAEAGKFGELAAGLRRFAIGAPVPGWHGYDTADGESASFTPDGPTAASDPMLLYFTSGTTANAKLVLHSHASYPVGHLSTMYWLGLGPGDIHLNISSPGWAKHAWSCFFAPWNAGATVFLYNYTRFDAPALLDTMRRCGVTTFCAPPTVWRMLIQQDLKQWDLPLREVVGAGEP